MYFFFLNKAAQNKAVPIDQGDGLSVESVFNGQLVLKGLGPLSQI